VTNLRRSFFWAAIYLAIIFVLAQADYTDRPIINFASYFYLAVMIAVPVTFFFPGVSRVSVYVPLAIWAAIYLVLLQILDRTLSTTTTTSLGYPIIVLEFVLLEVGVWFAFQLAFQISHAESVMDALALGAFPNRVKDIESESQRIKVEFTRSRRYNRPLSLLVLEADHVERISTREVVKSIQMDLMNRFTSARIGQIIDDRIRQTDLVLKDHRGRFLILCPETELAHVILLAKRIGPAITERIDLKVKCGVASFPNEALTFEDLMKKAYERLTNEASLEDLVVLENATQEVS
jgi:GGDEF domain-containing protein